MTSSALDRAVGVIGDFAYKAPCRVVAVTPITTTGTQTIDGVALAVLDRVLVTAQADTTKNGIYTVDTGAWQLAPDFLSSQSVARGSQIFITDGSVNAHSIWYIVATNPVNPQTPSAPSAITITKLSIGGGSGGGIAVAAGANSITSGTALFSNSGGVSWGFNGQTITASVNTSYRASNDGLGLNTAGSNITWTANSNGVSIDARNYAGTVTGATNATLTMNSAGLSVSVAAPGAATNAVGLNTANSNVTWTVNTSGISLDARGYAGTGLSLTNATATLNSVGLQLSIAAPGGGVAVTASAYGNNFGGISGSNGNFLQDRYSQCISFNLPYYLSASFLRLAATMADQSTTIATTGASMSASADAYSTWNAVVYSMGTGASSRSLMFVASGSCGWTQRNSISVAANGTQGSYTQAMTYQIEGNSASISTQYSISDTNYPFSSTLFSGVSSARYLDIPFANSLSPGPYWLVVGLKTTNATNSTGISVATRCSVGYSRHYVALQANSNILTMGGPNTPLGEYGGGVFTTNVASTTSAFASSLINNENGLAMLWFQMLRSA